MADEKITDLKILLSKMNPVLEDGEYVFVSLKEDNHRTIGKLEPICTFHEKEGISLIISQDKAEELSIEHSPSYKMITLSVYSSLEAIGFLSAVLKNLAAENISMNAVSAYHHDYLFVLSSQAEKAMNVLKRVMNDEEKEQG